MLHLPVLRLGSPNIRQFILAYDVYGFPHLKSEVSLKVLPLFNYKLINLLFIMALVDFSWFLHGDDFAPFSKSVP